MFDENGVALDLTQIMKRYIHMNPHISLSDIAFLMDLPYEQELEEYDQITGFENIEPAENDARP